MPHSIHFTKSTIDALQPPVKGRILYSDDSAPGLKLRVTEKGMKTFVVVKKARGKVHFITLGHFPDTTVSEARLMAGDEAAKLARGESTTRDKPKAVTLRELFDRWMDCHAQGHKKTWLADQKNFDRYLSRLHKVPVKDIDREQLKVLHTRLGAKNGIHTANRVLALLKTVFSFAEEVGVLSGPNPARVKLFAERSRDRFLSPDELKRFFEALDDVQTPEIYRDLFSMLLWTGARRSNVLAMRWADIDLTARRWRIDGSEFKNSDTHMVVLSDAAASILIRRLAASGGSTWVFPSGGSKSGHVEEPKKVWADVLKRADIENLRIHDLRRTMGSWQAATGASLPIIGKTLGHRNQSTTEVYARLNLDPVRNAVDKATAAMQDAIRGD